MRTLVRSRLTMSSDGSGARMEIVASGEAYETKASAKEGCEAVKRAAEGASIVEVES